MRHDNLQMAWMIEYGPPSCIAGNCSKRLKVVMSRDEDLLLETVAGLTSLPIVAP